jgi:hypothetical protein
LVAEGIHANGGLELCTEGVKVRRCKAHQQDLPTPGWFGWKCDGTLEGVLTGSTGPRQVRLRFLWGIGHGSTGPR